jgi:adenylate kinase family enzyme
VLSKETPQPSTLQEQLLYIEFAYLFANLHRRRMETTILPIVVLLGIPGSGKGTLGKKLAAEFNLHHISLGDWTRDLYKAPISGISARINDLVKSEVIIPDDILAAEYGNVPVPVVLQMYNCKQRNENIRSIPYALRMAPFVKTLQDISSCATKGGPRAILLDGYPRVLSDAKKLEELLGNTFPYLAIFLECPSDVVMERYLQRARKGDTKVARFEERVKRFYTANPPILSYFRKRGLLVSICTDCSLEESYQRVLAELEGHLRWELLTTAESVPSLCPLPLFLDSR